MISWFGDELRWWYYLIWISCIRTVEKLVADMKEGTLPLSFLRCYRLQQDSDCINAVHSKKTQIFLENANPHCSQYVGQEAHVRALREGRQDIWAGTTSTNTLAKNLASCGYSKNLALAKNLASCGYWRWRTGTPTRVVWAQKSYYWILPVNEWRVKRTPPGPGHLRVKMAMASPSPQERGQERQQEWFGLSALCQKTSVNNVECISVKYFGKYW